MSKNKYNLLISLALMAVMSICFVGCGEKEVSEEQVIINQKPITEEIVVEVGSEISLQISSKDLEDFEVKIPENDGVAKIEDGELKIGFSKVGNFVVPLTINAKGYSETDLNLNVVVTPHEMPLDVLLLTSPSNLETAKPIPDGKVAFENQNSVSFLINSADGADVTVSCDESVASYKLDGKVLTIIGKKIGKTDVKISAKLENYKDAEFSFSAEVLPQNAKLKLSQNSLTINLNEKASVTLDTFDGTNIELAYPTELLNAVIVENNLKITALKYGTGTVTVKATKDGYLANEQTISVSVPYPKTALTLSKENLELKTGENAEVTFSVNYNDANITIKTASGDAVSQAQGNTVKITAGQENSQVKIIATHPNGGVDEKTVNVTIKKEVAKQSAPSDQMAKDIIYYTNKYREKLGIAPLSYVSDVDPASKIRAKEASVKWSHTRPDGTGFHTVFDETGLSEKYTHTGENLFMSNYKPTAEEVVDKWIASPSHEENLRRESFTGVSVHFFLAGNGEYYCAQLFVE